MSGAVSGSVAVGAGSTTSGEVGRVSESGSASVAEGKSEKVDVEGYTCEFGRTWHASGASVDELINEIGELFVYRGRYPLKTIDAILVAIWRRIDVKDEVVKKSMLLDRDTFEALMAAFERTEVMRSREISMVRERYGVDSELTCTFGRKWIVAGKSEQALLDEMRVLFMYMHATRDVLYDTVLVQIWRALGASANPIVRQKVVAQSIAVVRYNFDARVDAFRRLGLMSKEELMRLESEYKADEERMAKEKQEYKMDQTQEPTTVRGEVYARVQSSPHKSLIDSGIWNRTVSSLSATDLRALLYCLDTSPA